MIVLITIISSALILLKLCIWYEKKRIAENKPKFKNEITVDINPKLNPIVIADALHTPFADNTFNLVLTHLI
ncbi:MAG: hypothetical protein AB1485_00090 [Candidatus Thermoplasmatota archaeon]